MADSARPELTPHNESHDAGDARWDGRSPHRLVAAYQIGRLLNQLDWQLQIVLFFVSPTDEAMVGPILQLLRDASYALVGHPPNQLEEVIARVRDRWKADLCSEAVAEDVATCFANQERTPEFDTGEPTRQELVESLVRPLVGELRNCIWKEISEAERWATEVGLRLDQCIRPPDLYRFIEIHRSDRDGSSVGNQEGGRFRLVGPSWQVRSIEPGDFKAEAALPDELEALLTNTKMPFAASAEILAKWTTANKQSPARKMLRVVELLDQIIRQELGKCHDNAAEEQIQVTQVRRSNRQSRNARPPSNRQYRHPLR
jgi:hypothetical protein